MFLYATSRKVKNKMFNKPLDRDLVRISVLVKGDPTRLFSFPDGKDRGEHGEPTDTDSSLITFPSINPCCNRRRDFIILLLLQGFATLSLVFHN